MKVETACSALSPGEKEVADLCRRVHGISQEAEKEPGLVGPRLVLERLLDELTNKLVERREAIGGTIPPRKYFRAYKRGVVEQRKHDVTGVGDGYVTVSGCPDNPKADIYEPAYTDEVWTCPACGKRLRFSVGTIHEEEVGT